MAAKQRTKDELALDWVSDQLWMALLSKQVKLRKCIIKGGLNDWLVVLSVTIEDEPQVAFIGAPTLSSVLQKLMREVQEDSISWREDKFAN